MVRTGNRDVHGEVLGWKVTERFDITSQGEAAERLCDKWNLTREELDDYASESHRRAADAADRGYFQREIVPITPANWCERNAPSNQALSNQDTVTADETIRRDTSRAKLANLRPSFRTDGRLTAGNSSQIADGAAAALLMSGAALDRFGVRPRGRIVATVTVGSDPELMLTGPIAAARLAASRANLRLDDIALFEVNEAFAPVPLIWMRELGIGPERLNISGGAIALGHPLGATGARIMSSLLANLERTRARYGLQAICCNGGMATASVIERLE